MSQPSPNSSIDNLQNDDPNDDVRHTERELAILGKGPLPPSDSNNHDATGACHAQARSIAFPRPFRFKRHNTFTAPNTSLPCSLQALGANSAFAPDEYDAGPSKFPYSQSYVRDGAEPVYPNSQQRWSASEPRSPYPQPQLYSSRDSIQKSSSPLPNRDFVYQQTRQVPRRESIHQPSASQPFPRPDSVQQPSTSQSFPRRDSVHQPPTPQSFPRPDSIQQPPLSHALSRNDYVQQAPSSQPFRRRGSVHQPPSPQSFSRYDLVHQSSASQPFPRRDSIQQPHPPRALSRHDSVQQPSTPQSYLGQDSIQRTPSSQPFSRHDSVHQAPPPPPPPPPPPQTYHGHNSFRSPHPQPYYNPTTQHLPQVDSYQQPHGQTPPQYYEPAPSSNSYYPPSHHSYTTASQQYASQSQSSVTYTSPSGYMNPASDRWNRAPYEVANEVKDSQMHQNTVQREQHLVDNFANLNLVNNAQSQYSAANPLSPEQVDALKQFKRRASAPVNAYPLSEQLNGMKRAATVPVTPVVLSQHAAPPLYNGGRRATESVLDRPGGPHDSEAGIASLTAQELALHQSLFPTTNKLGSRLMQKFLRGRPPPNVPRLLRRNRSDKLPDPSANNQWKEF